MNQELALSRREWKARLEAHADYYRTALRESESRGEIAEIALRFLSRWRGLFRLQVGTAASGALLFLKLCRELSVGQYHVASECSGMKRNFAAWLVQRVDVEGWPGDAAAVALAEGFEHHFRGLAEACPESAPAGARLARRWAELARTNPSRSQRRALYLQASESPFAERRLWFMFPDLIRRWAEAPNAGLGEFRSGS